MKLRGQSEKRKQGAPYCSTLCAASSGTAQRLPPAISAARRTLSAGQQQQQQRCRQLTATALQHGTAQQQSCSSCRGRCELCAVRLSAGLRLWITASSYWHVSKTSCALSEQA